MDNKLPTYSNIDGKISSKPVIKKVATDKLEKVTNMDPVKSIENKTYQDDQLNLEPAEERPMKKILKLKPPKESKEKTRTLITDTLSQDILCTTESNKRKENILNSNAALRRKAILEADTEAIMTATTTTANARQSRNTSPKPAISPTIQQKAKTLKLPRNSITSAPFTAEKTKSNGPALRPPKRHNQVSKTVVDKNALSTATTPPNNTSRVDSTAAFSLQRSKGTRQLLQKKQDRKSTVLASLDASDHTHAVTTKTKSKMKQEEARHVKMFGKPKTPDSVPRPKSEQFSTFTIRAFYGKCFDKLNEIKLGSRKQRRAKQGLLNATTVSGAAATPDEDEEEDEQQPTQRRSVRFSPSVKIFPILPLEEYTQEEIYLAWFQNEEYDSIIHKCYKVIRNMELGDNVNKHCTRGLERMTEAGIQARDNNRAQAYGAVFYEQGIQWQEDRFDEDTIAELYVALSSHCQRRATEVGRSDAFAAKKCKSTKKAKKLLVSDENKPTSPCPPVPPRRIAVPRAA
jgi:hypothetical protein